MIRSENSVNFNVRNMNCGSCVGRVEKALLAVPVAHAATAVGYPTTLITDQGECDPRPQSGRGDTSQNHDAGCRGADAARVHSGNGQPHDPCAASLHHWIMNMLGLRLNWGIQFVLTIISLARIGISISKASLRC